MRRVCAGICMAIVGSLLIGCGGGKPAEPVLDLVPVSGVVTLDGNPLKDATVSFIYQGTAPKGFNGSGAKTGPDGKFQIQTGSKPGTVAGSYKVVVSRISAPDGSVVKIDPDAGLDLAQLQAAGQAKEDVPDKYSNPDATELTATVQKGDTKELEFKLTGS